MDLANLNAFIAIAEAGSFSEAAERLHLTQPAVSAQVHQLEEAVASLLFDRVGRSVRLTDAGRVLLRGVDAIEHTLENAEEALAALRGVKAGMLKVGAVDTANYFAASLVNTFGALHPAVNIRYAVDELPEIVNQLVEGHTDVIIVSRAPTAPELVSEPFARHPYVVIAAPDHPLARQRRVTAQDLFREKVVTREPGGLARTILEELAQQSGASFDPAMETTSNETIKQTVMAGFGIGCLSGHTIGLELQARKLVVLRVAGFPVIRHWHVIKRRDRVLPPVAAAFRAWLMSDGARNIDEVLGRELARLIGAPAVEAVTVAARPAAPGRRRARPALSRA